MSSNDICNVASLEHCYTNLFSLIDLTGIKWLRLRERSNKQPEASKVNYRTTLKESCFKISINRLLR